MTADPHEALWEAVLLDARKIDPTDLWEQCKLLAGIQGLVSLEKITDEQAYFARQIYLDRCAQTKKPDVQTSDEIYRNRVWQRMIEDARLAICTDDPWLRLKVVTGMSPFSTLNLISQEQFDYVHDLIKRSLA